MSWALRSSSRWPAGFRTPRPGPSNSQALGRQL
jgi:hypothetical protein